MPQEPFLFSATIYENIFGKQQIIIVSHRLSAVRYADNIIVLENGKITEHGNHVDLIENDRYYAKIFRMQEIEEYNE